MKPPAAHNHLAAKATGEITALGLATKPGTWGLHFGAVVLSCPPCAIEGRPTLIAVDGTGGFTIDSEGVVAPAVTCATCGWAAWVRLDAFTAPHDGWEAPAPRPHPLAEWWHWVDCPTCGALKGVPCGDRNPGDTHLDRIRAARAARLDRPATQAPGAQPASAPTADLDDLRAVLERFPPSWRYGCLVWTDEHAGSLDSLCNLQGEDLDVWGPCVDQVVTDWKANQARRRSN